MDKTRMGKRVASLLLSLVMMLSLLPTAAYAAMGYADDTQGAIVSENGTDVSDDSNSSGGTGDLQVEDSEGNGDTGAQQVGDSSGSGTADDTTGAEGGADPTDSVNGNDSADPQDDGDAVLPTAANVVSTSEELVAAIAAASDGDTITLGEGEFTTVGNTSPKKSLTFEGAGTGTVWTIGNLSKDVKGEGNGDCSFDGCETITFQNMTLKSDGADYRGFIRISNTAVKKCTLVGKTAYWGYETAKFEDSTFNAPVGDYALWDYSTKAMTFEGCTFNISGKGVNVYVEQPSTDARTVEVNGCTVNSDKAGKAFLNIKNSTQAFDVTLSGTNTVTGLEANGTTGSALYQVETTEVTETTGKPVAVKAKADDGTVTTLYEVKETVEASVAEVNGVGYESLQAAIDAAKSGATVTLLADTYENVTIAKAMTLDLNGHTLNGGTVKATPALKVDNCSVTVKDSSAAQNGTIMREDTAENSGVSSHYVIDIQGKYGFLKFEGGNVKNNSGTTSGKGASLIRLGNDNNMSANPTLTIKGGTFTQDNFIAIKVDHGTLHLLDGTVNSANSFAVENWNNAYIKGGTVNGTVSTWVYSTGAAFSKLTISGGTVNGNVASVNYDNAADKQARVYVTGGTVTGTLGTYTYKNGLVAMDETAKATIEVTGGTFSKDPTKYVVEDSAINKNDDGTFGVAKAYLAKVGGTSYYTMDEAFHAAVASGETLTLLRDYTTGSSQNSGSKSFTIDLNGFTWTYTGKDVDCAAFEINYSDVTLTVKNGKVVSSQLAGLIPSAMSGTITYDNSGLVFENVEMTANGHSGIETNGSNTNDTVTLKNSTLNVPNGYGIYFPSSGTLTIDNSVINAKTMGVQICSGSLNVTGDKTAITVTGDGVAKTENDGAIEDGAAISIVNRAGYKGLSNIEVKDGKFKANGTNAAVKAYKWEEQTASAFDNSKNVVAISGGTFSSEVAKSLCADGFIPTKNEDGTYGVKEGKYVAEIGSQGYESLTEAVAAAEDGQTVTLLADAAEDVVISKSITLDLGGKTLTNTNGGKATISVTGGTVTVKNGNVVGGTSYYNIEAKKDANLTLTDVTATAGNTGSSMIDNWGTLTITSGTYTGGLNVVKSEEGSVLNISGGTFTLSYATSGYTGVIFAYGDTTISGGEFIQSLTTTGRWNHPTVILTGVVEGYAAITRVTGGHFVNKMSGESIFRGVGKGTSDNFEVSGGTFNKSIPDGYCADGFIPTKNTDGTYGVKEGQYVAKVGSTKYETLADAIRLAAKGKTVKLLADVADCGSLTISKNITLDGGGHTISGNSSISVNMPGNAAADVTIKNVNFKDIANGNKLSAFYFSQVKGKLTITGCTFDSIEYEAIQVTPMEGAEVNVSSNVFKAKADGTQVRHIHIEMAYGSGFDCEGQNIKLTVTDNQLHGTVSGDASMGIWWVGTDSTLKVDGNYMEHPETVSITLSNGGVHYNRGDLIYPARSQADADVDDLIPAVIVADKASGESKIKAYSTLADAVAAAENGQTVRLLADVTLDAQIATGKAITIDGQSKYTIKAAKKLASADGKAGMFYRTQSAKGTLTFLNVTLDGGGVSKIFLNEGGAGETVFDGVTSTNGGGIAYGSGIHISGGGSHATIRNSTLTGSTGTMELNNANYYAANDLWVGGNVYVTVENSVIGNVFVNSAPSATATNGVVHGQLTITGEKTKITYLSGEEEAADKLDKFGNNGSLVKIDSGYVEKVFDKGSYAISGGTFKTEVKKEWCAAGYVPADNGNGTYGVEVGKFTVKVTSRTTGSDSPVANVAGGGSDITYAEGTTVTASAISGYNFVGWFVNEYTGTPYSTDLACEVKPTADCTMIAVYEPISGGVFALEVSASKFTVNGGATQRSYLLEKMPIGTQVTVVFKGSENFLYWVNESGKVVSTSKTYTFSMGSATTLKAVYAEKEEHQAMVVFISHTQQVISSKGYTDTQEIQFPEPPIKMGATFVRWSMTEAEIRAAMATTTTGIIVVEPVYEFSAGSYTVTVNYPNDETATYTATVGKITTVTAKSIDGKVFKCWKNGDTVLGYTETLKIAPRGDLTLTAEYVDAGTTVDRLPVIALTEISASQQGAKYAVSFTATRSVPDGYTVTEQGILVSTNSRYGQSDALDAMKLDANGAKPDDTFILKATNTDATGVTVLNGTVSAADRTVYGRAYMILRDSSGAMVYVYSDTILSGSYNSLTTNGGN